MGLRECWGAGQLRTVTYGSGSGRGTNLAVMSLDLEKGYTRTEIRRGGLAAGRQRQREMPAGDPHAVVRGEGDTLCGQVVRVRLPFPLGMGETLCPECAKEMEKLESAD
jgi:hypothetical protein